MKDIALRVSSVSKDFVLPHEKAGTLKGAFTGLLKGKKSWTLTTQHALRDIDFDVQEGEFFGIVGRNGSGKSTLLKILAGIYQPTRGSVEHKGRLVPFIELGVGFNPELTGRENVFLNGALLGFSEEEVTAMYDDVVNFAELENFMDQKLKNYSSGMQVRLAFSMATRAQADILLVDEVLAVGDADFQRKCFEYFKQLKREEKTVVFVSHDMSAVREYCDRAVLIESSEQKNIGPPDSIAEEYIKMFNKEQEHEWVEQVSKDRWGDGSITISKIKAEISNKDIELRMTLESSDAAEYRPILGFRIRDAAGKEVTGTNTKIEKIQLDLMGGGVKKEIICLLPNVLSDGKYYVDTAVHHANGITVADWWNGAAKLVIRKKRRLPYAVDPQFEFTIK